MALGDSILIQNAKVAATQLVDQAGSWFGEIKSRVACWLQDLDLTPNKMIEIGSYLGVGFLIGLLLKKYFQGFLLFALLLAGTVWALVEFDLIVINWHMAQDLAHVAPDDTVGKIFSGYTFWVKQNLLMVVSGLIGFIIGYKVG